VKPHTKARVKRIIDLVLGGVVVPAPNNGNKVGPGKLKKQQSRGNTALTPEQQELKNLMDTLPKSIQHYFNSHEKMKQLVELEGKFTGNQKVEIGKYIEAVKSVLQKHDEEPEVVTGPPTTNGPVAGLPNTELTTEEILALDRQPRSKYVVSMTKAGDRGWLWKLEHPGRRLTRHMQALKVGNFNEPQKKLIYRLVKSCHGTDKFIRGVAHAWATTEEVVREIRNDEEIATEAARERQEQQQQQRAEEAAADMGEDEDVALVGDDGAGEDLLGADVDLGGDTLFDDDDNNNSSSSSNLDGVEDLEEGEIVGDDAGANDDVLQDDGADVDALLEQDENGSNNNRDGVEDVADGEIVGDINDTQVLDSDGVDGMDENVLQDDGSDLELGGDTLFDEDDRSSNNNNNNSSSGSGSGNRDSVEKEVEDDRTEHVRVPR